MSKRRSRTRAREPSLSSSERTSCVAVTKFVGAVITGSAAMSAEATHALADVGNQRLLFTAQRRGSRPSTRKHPLGCGRNAYSWALIASIVVFVAGAAFSLREGTEELTHPIAGSSFNAVYVALTSDPTVRAAFAGDLLRRQHQQTARWRVAGAEGPTVEGRRPSRWVYGFGAISRHLRRRRAPRRADHRRIRWLPKCSHSNGRQRKQWQAILLFGASCSSVPDAIDSYGARQHRRLDVAADALGSVHPSLKVDTVTTHLDPRDPLTVGLAASDLLVIGAPAPSSSILASRLDTPCASLLVLGSRGRSGFKTLLFGSVALQVAAHAQCPVWILHPQPFRGSDSE